jgi:signal transduction histidine kinase
MNAFEGLVELYNCKAKTLGELKDYKSAFLYTFRSDSLRKSFNYGKISQLLAEREKALELNRKLDQVTLLNRLESESMRVESLKIRKRLSNLFFATIFLIIMVPVTLFFIVILRRKNHALLLMNTKTLDQQRKLEESLKILEENKVQLARSNLTKDRLFSIIGHDLENPLSIINDISQIYLEKDGDFNVEDIQPFLASIKPIADYGQNLLKNLLQWSLSNTGDFIACPEKFHIDQSIDELLSGLKPKLEQKNIQVDYSSDKECFVFADINMVKAILRNLLHNAIKFSNMGGTITIGCTEKQGEAIISIADKGVGMTEETRLSILSGSDFESRFGTNNEKGSGLGLILCKEFIQLNSGKLWIDSIENKGSVFSFSLPMAKK